MNAEAAKKARQKWDKANMKTYTVHLRTEQADEFRAAALSAGTTPAALLKKFVLDYIADNPDRTDNDK